MILKAITDLQIVSHTRLLEMRKLDRILNSYVFIESWKQFSEKQKLAVVKLIKRVKVNQIKLLLEKHDLEHSPVITLRKAASHLHIKNYSRKPKLQLIQEIKDARKRYENQHRATIIGNEKNSIGSR